MTTENTQVALARKELDEGRSEIDAGLKLIQDFQITNPDDQEFAAEILRDVKAKHKELERRRKVITVPLNTALREVNDLFRPLRTALETGERLLKGKIAAYQAEQAEAQAKALEEVASADTEEEAEGALAGVVEAVVEAPVGVNVRYKWKAWVSNPEMVPYEFLSPDIDKINRHIAAADGEPSPIAGVKFEKVSIVTSRGVG